MSFGHNAAQEASSPDHRLPLASDVWQRLSSILELWLVCVRWVLCTDIDFATHAEGFSHDVDEIELPCDL